MKRNCLWQAVLMLTTLLLALNVITPWLFAPTSSHGARPTEYKVVSLLEIPFNTPKEDVMHTPLGQLAKDKARAMADGLQQIWIDYAKDGWEVHTIDMSGGMFVLKK
jgi:hypothetical protein